MRNLADDNLFGRLRVNIYRIVDISVSLLVNEHKPGAAGVQEQLLDAHNMQKLIHILPVLDGEIIDATSLKFINRQVSTHSTQSTCIYFRYLVILHGFSITKLNQSTVGHKLQTYEPDTIANI